MKQYDIGLDLGTTSIIIATQEQGVVFHQPSIGAVDTRSSTILAVGDKALRMVGRVPSYIDIYPPFAGRYYSGPPHDKRTNRAVYQ